MQRLTGIGVSPGVASGRVVILIQGARTIRFSVPPERVEAEVSRLEDARRRSRTQLEAIRARLGRAGGTEMAALFDAQVLMIDDPMLVARAAGAIREQRVNAEWALQHAFDDLSSVFDEVEDPYLRERKGDLADVVGRLRMNLRHDASSPRDLFKDFDEPCILIADELTPSMAAQLDWSHISNTPDHSDAAIQGLKDARIRAVYAHGMPTGGEWWMLSELNHPEDIRRIRETYFSSGDGLITLAMASIKRPKLVSVSPSCRRPAAVRR